jgi:hypothetical protein
MSFASLIQPIALKIAQKYGKIIVGVILVAPLAIFIPPYYFLKEDYYGKAKY